MKKYNLHKIIAGCLLCAAAVTGSMMLSSCGKTENVRQQEVRKGFLVKPEGVELSIPGTIYGSLNGKEKVKLPLGTYVVRMTADGCNPVWETVKLSEPGAEVTPQERPVAVKASVLVKSVPAGAQVFVDDESRGITPCVVSNLDRGPHKVTFRSVGYDDITTSLEILNAEPRVLEQTLSRNTGNFVVVFEPADAEIFLDGKKKHGFSPLTLTETAGTHKLEIRKDKYESVEETITIRRGGEDQKEFKLNPVSGSLTVHVTYPASATIMLDGREIKNGTRENLKPGKYKVNVSARGFDTKEEEVEISAAETEVLQIALNANTGKIILPVNEPYVTISLNGRTIGMTQPDPRDPDAAELFEISGVSEGTYNLSFWHPNTPKTEERKVTVSKDVREVRLPRVDVWLPNASVTMQGQVYKDCRVTPVEGTDRVKFVRKKINSDGSIATTSEEVLKSALKIDYYGDKSVYANPEFKTSRVDFLTYEDNLATITIKNLRPGCEIFTNGKSAGIARFTNMVLRVKPGSYTIRIAHKHGKNVKKPNQNYVENTNPLELVRGGSHTMNAPGAKILWIPDTKLVLKNGGVLIGKTLSESEDTLSIQTEPGSDSKRDVNRGDIARKELLD